MKNKTLAAWLILILLSFIWGSSFILMKKGLEVYSPTQVASLRILLSSLLFFPIFIKNFNKIDWSLWPYIIIVALTGSGFPAFLFATAQTEISSSLTGILNSLTPLFTFIFGVLFFKSAFRWVSFSGVLLGLAGAGLMILLSSQSGLDGNLWYALLAVLAAAFYGISGNTVKTYLNSFTAFNLNATTFSLWGPFVLIYLLSTNFFAILTSEEGAWEALGYIAILSWIGTFAATVLFFMVIQWTNALFGSTVAYFIPIVAVIWGLIDGEQLSWYHLVGLSMIISGVYAIRQGRTKK